MDKSFYSKTSLASLVTLTKPKDSKRVCILHQLSKKQNRLPGSEKKNKASTKVFCGYRGLSGPVHIQPDFLFEKCKTMQVYYKLMTLQGRFARLNAFSTKSPLFVPNFPRVLFYVYHYCHIVNFAFTGWV